MIRRLFETDRCPCEWRNNPQTYLPKETFAPLALVDHFGVDFSKAVLPLQPEVSFLPVDLVHVGIFLLLQQAENFASDFRLMARFRVIVEMIETQLSPDEQLLRHSIGIGIDHAHVDDICAVVQPSHDLELHFHRQPIECRFTRLDIRLRCTRSSLSDRGFEPRQQVDVPLPQRRRANVVIERVGGMNGSMKLAHEPLHERDVISRLKD